MTELPSSVRVACFDFVIEDWPNRTATAAGKYGEFSGDEEIIRIDTSRSAMCVLDTFLHEIGHAIYLAYGLEDEDKEERIVATFATAWTQVFRDNPDVVRFIEACRG